MQNRLICIAKITSAHGIKGAVKIRSYTEDPLSIGDYPVLYNKDGSAEYELQIQSNNKEAVIAFIDGVNDRNEAEALKGKDLYVYRDDFEDVGENEFYYEDLVGLRVKLQNGTEYGEIISIQNYGAGDIVEIRLKKDKKKELFSFTKDIFPNINIKSGSVIIVPPDIENVEK
ncbi:MAG: ribosome maturation factor RimM [Rickettsiales bacterium]|nr:ribosome maturation factor RimM [Pseudomonadota bacterium]MDA0966736.1 ribosome maturation factor RimM [Pseudomonadota bacterium]MDG4543409.1 ribosome maturation factor RimM [Rickettsiales bacterium]MDG4546197.1 ribosome maturation factor RimM [Rickettsiales bacterium]MDG4547670.1 ribosome maturation factor RimM [Rickettsiales bacterium]